MMMLITLTVLLPAVQPIRDDCQALDVEIVKPDNLTEPVKKGLGKQISPKSVSDIDGIATYYIGYPDTLDKDFQFTAVCLSTTMLDERPYCFNVTLKSEDISSAKISEQQFLDFYRNCSNDPTFELKYNTTATTIQTDGDN